jgi:hypothetical protein
VCERGVRCEMQDRRVDGFPFLIGMLLKEKRRCREDVGLIWARSVPVNDIEMRSGHGWQHSPRAILRISRFVGERRRGDRRGEGKTDSCCVCRSDKTCCRGRSRFPVRLGRVPARLRACALSVRHVVPLFYPSSPFQALSVRQLRRIRPKDPGSQCGRFPEKPGLEGPPGKSIPRYPS